MGRDHENDIDITFRAGERVGSAGGFVAQERTVFLGGEDQMNVNGGKETSRHLEGNLRAGLKIPVWSPAFRRNSEQYSTRLK